MTKQNLSTSGSNIVASELSETPVLVKNIAARFKDKMKEKLSENDFSITEHICHLRDLEIEAYAPRIGRILAETKPFLPDFKGGEIAFERDYNNQNAIAALEDFTIARKQTVEILNSAEPEQFARSGELEGIGEITLGSLINLMLQHDREHLKELKTLTEQL